MTNKPNNIQTVRLTTAGDASAGIKPEYAKITPEGNYLMDLNTVPLHDQEQVLTDIRGHLEEAFALMWDDDPVTVQFDITDAA
jgi:hypothetical protein